MILGKTYVNEPDLRTVVGEYCLTRTELTFS